MTPYRENIVITTILKWIFKKYDSGQTGFIWLRIGTSDRLLKIRKISSLPKEILASQGLCSMQLISHGDDHEDYWSSRM
jgi:hypothetical protein